MILALIPSFLDQELDSAPSGVILVSFGTMWLPDDETMAAVLTALAKSPVKVIMKSPSKKQQPFNEECSKIIANASNIVLVSWLPQVSNACGRRLESRVASLIRLAS